MVEKTFKIFSYCNDFDETLQDELAQDRGYDCYIEYTAMTKETEIKKNFDNDPIANRLIELGANNEEEVLIHLDW